MLTELIDDKNMRYDFLQIHIGFHVNEFYLVNTSRG